MTTIEKFALAILLSPLLLAALVTGKASVHPDWPQVVEAISALASAAFSASLLVITVRQSRIAERQATIMDGQLAISQMQTDILVKQKEISRLGHLATHRPRLAVRNIVIEPIENEVQRQPHFSSGKTAHGQLYVVNRGGSEAWIRDALVIMHIQGDLRLPMKRPYEGLPGNIGRMNFPLLAGKSVPIQVPNMAPYGQDQALEILAGTLNKALFIMGWIEYTDGNYDFRSDEEILRRTAFCRAFDVLTGRFVNVSDDDYVYEE